MSDKFEQWFESEFPDADLSHHETLKGYNNLKYGWNAALSSLQGEQAAKIAELEAKLAEVEKDAIMWQPIETAPKDGTLLMVYSRTHGYVAAWWDQVDGGGHPENGPPVYWWVSDHCEFTDGPYDAPVMWRHLNELSDVLVAAIQESKKGGVV